MRGFGLDGELQATTNTLLKGFTKPQGMFDAGAATALVRLNDFACSIRHQPFDRAARAILSSGAAAGPILELVVRMADALRASRSYGASDILGKSLQETLFLIGDFHFDKRTFGKNAQAFVRESGCRGLIQLFLKLHLSNLMWKYLNDSSKTPLDVNSLERLPNCIERLCRKSVNATTTTWKKWPELNEVSAGRLLHSLNSEMQYLLAEPVSCLPRAG